MIAAVAERLATVAVYMVGGYMTFVQVKTWWTVLEAVFT